jgi:phosphoribosylamine-glycine ligase
VLSKTAAEPESPKFFSNFFIWRHGNPKSETQSFSDHIRPRNISRQPHRVLIQVSGFAAGKELVLPTSVEEVELNLEEVGSVASSAQLARVVIEEHTEGEDIGMSAFSDGKAFKSLQSDRDYK